MATRLWRSVRTPLQGTLAVVGRSDLALAVCGVITAVTVALAIAPNSLVTRVVSVTSTNLANLRTHPLQVLVASVFVVPELEGLVMVMVLLVALAYGQAWVGRFATVTVAVIGHVGATLFVAMLLTTGMADRMLPRSIMYAKDVGVSYALAAVLGWLAARVPRHWRAPYIGLVVLWFLGPAVFTQTFTDAGHATALALGLSLAVLSVRSGRVPAEGVPRNPLAAVDESRSVEGSGKEVVEE